jgi:hypothetical protein
MGELRSSREGRKRIKKENSICKARREKEAEMDKAGKKVENMHKWSTTEQGLSVHQRPETSPSSTRQGRRLPFGF